MTYFSFHLTFNLPAFLLLLWLTRRRLQAEHWKWIAVVGAIVMVAASPWDNWAVHHGIWGFDWNRVTPVEIPFRGIVWRLPAEEYAFFLIETVLVALVCVLYLPAGKEEGGRKKAEITAGARLFLHPSSFLLLPFLAAATAPVTLFHDRSLNYLVHLVGWSAPILAGQWALAHAAFRRNLRAIVAPTLIGGTFFSLIDSVAVHSGIWHFDPAQNVGIFIGPLPLEEMLFFYLTSWLVAQSFVMFLPDRLRH
ncbi:MAG: lycopene cyclase domain-containing protein [Verrucomicrobia bacterium]|nr:lycopene cyclase domain-containing protein [Verrucomicrobiota bacterium]